MAIRWKDIFRALGAGASYAAESMREERIDKREEQQAMQRARYMDYLERRRLSMSQAFQKKMAEHEAELQLKNQIRKKEIDTMFDTLGVTLTRKALQNQQLPTGDPNKDKNQAQIDMAMNMMAEAKGERRTFPKKRWRCYLLISEWHLLLPSLVTRDCSRN